MEGRTKIDYGTGEDSRQAIASRSDKLTSATVVPVNFHEIPLVSLEILPQVQIDSAAEALTHTRLSWFFLPSAALATDCQLIQITQNSGPIRARSELTS